MVSIRSNATPLTYYSIVLYGLCLLLSILALLRIFHRKSQIIGWAWTGLSISLVASSVLLLLSALLEGSPRAPGTFSINQQSDAGAAGFLWAVTHSAPIAQQATAVFLLIVWRVGLEDSGRAEKFLKIAYATCISQAVAFVACLIWAILGSIDDASAALSSIAAVNFLLLLVPLLGFSAELHDSFLHRGYSGYSRSEWWRLGRVFASCLTACGGRPEYFKSRDPAATALYRFSLQAVTISFSAFIRTIAAIADAIQELSSEDVGSRYAEDAVGIQVAYGMYSFIAEAVPVACIVIFTMSEPWRSYFMAKPLLAKLGCVDVDNAVDCWRPCRRKPAMSSHGVLTIDPSLLLSSNSWAQVPTSTTSVQPEPRTIGDSSLVGNARGSSSSVFGDEEFDVQAPSSYISSSFTPRMTGMLIPPSPARTIMKAAPPPPAPSQPSSYNTSSFTSQFFGSSLNNFALNPSLPSSFAKSDAPK